MSDSPIVIPEKEFVAEHKELVKVLTANEPKTLAKEAKKQADELKKTIETPIEKQTKNEISQSIKEHLKKQNKSVALSALNKKQLIAVYRKIVG